MNVGALQRALEAAGVEFLDYGSPGVRLRPGGADNLKPTGPATSWIMTVRIVARCLDP